MAAVAPSYGAELARRFAPRRAPYRTPGLLARALNPKTVQTEALDLIDEALLWAAETPDARLIITMPPQEGKSVRVAGDFPTWLLTRNPDLRIVVASYGQDLATRNGRSIRTRITAHPDLGLRIARDNGRASEWTIAGRTGGVFSVGIGGGLTGRPADALIIDDPIKDVKEAESQQFRDDVYNWWQAVAGTRLAPGAPVVIILTRWHDDDLAGRLLKESAKDPDAEQWRVVNIPAVADHRAELGESDSLGREVGQWLRSARGRTAEQWGKIRKRVGARVWASLYQGRPAPTTGNLFPRKVWDGPGTPEDPSPWRYSEALWIDGDGVAKIVPGVDYEHAVLVQSWDMTFKDTEGSDYVVGQVWLRRGVDAYLLDQVRARLDFLGTVAAFRQLTAKWPQATLKLVEDKANGSAVISSLSRTIGGIVPVEPDGSKMARATATTPFVEAGNIHLPTAEVALFDVEEFIVEAESFGPAATHDDQVDAYSQAVMRLLLDPLATAGATGGLDSDDIVGEEYDYLSAW